MAISIHAPARGATGLVHQPREYGSISIHAPARGATNSYVYVGGEITHFNPRPCARGDMQGTL